MNKMMLAVAVTAAFSAIAMAQTKAQTACPVMGEPLGKNPISVKYSGKKKAYAGKSVKVCCQGCVEGVKKDQDKIFKKVTGK
jgi:hypothetical protein